MRRLTTTHVGWSIGAALVFVATAIAGATEHLPALLLRAVVVFGVLHFWSTDLVALRRRDLVPAVIAALALAWGAMRSSEPGLALQDVVSATLVVLLYLTVLTHERSAAHPLLRLALLVAVLHGAWAIAQGIVGSSSRARGGFFNPNDLAALIAPMFLIAAPWTTLGARMFEAWPRPRLSAWITAALMAAALVATGSRSGMLAATVGSAVSLVPIIRRRPGRVALLATALLGAALLLYPRWTGRGDRYAYSRAQIWSASVALALTEPLGVGLGDYADTMRQRGVPLPGRVRYPKVATQAHCEPLTAWVEMGWLGLLASLVPVLLVLGAIYAAARRGEGHAAADLGVLVAFAVPALLSASLHVPPVAFLAAIWAGTVVAADPSPANTLSIGRPGRLAIAATAVGALLLALPGAASSYATQRAASLRDAGRLEAARTVAAWAHRTAPWSLAAAMLDESMRYLTGAAPLEVGESLLALSEAHPSAPEPVARAAWLLAREAASRHAPPEAWRNVAALYAEAARRDPHNAVRYADVAQSYERAGDADAARTAWERAVTEEPSFARGLAALARLAAERGETQRARVLAERAIDADRAAAQAQGHAKEILSLPEDSATMLRKHGLIHP